MKLFQYNRICLRAIIMLSFIYVCLFILCSVLSFIYGEDERHKTYQGISNKPMFAENVLSNNCFMVIRDDTICDKLAIKKSLLNDFHKPMMRVYHPDYNLKSGDKVFRFFTCDNTVFLCDVQIGASDYLIEDLRQGNICRYSSLVKEFESLSFRGIVFKTESPIKDFWQAVQEKVINAICFLAILPLLVILIISNIKKAVCFNTLKESKYVRPLIIVCTATIVIVAILFSVVIFVEKFLPDTGRKEYVINDMTKLNYNLAKLDCVIIEKEDSAPANFPLNQRISASGKIENGIYLVSYKNEPFAQFMIHKNILYLERVSQPNKTSINLYDCATSNVLDKCTLVRQFNNTVLNGVKYESSNVLVDVLGFIKCGISKYLFIFWFPIAIILILTCLLIPFRKQTHHETVHS